MNTMRLLTVLGEVDDRFIDDTPISEATPPRSAPLRYVGVAAAACVALLLSVLLIPELTSNGGVPLTSQTDPTDAVVTTQATTSTTTQTNTQTTVSTEPTKYVLTNPMSCYSRGPEVGEVFLDMYSLEYLKEDLQNDPNAKAWVEISMDDANGQPVLSSEAKYNEIKRLASLGYEMYIYESYSTDYWGAPRHITYVFGMLTLEQLENFAVGDFGYRIDSGNYVSIPFEDCERVE